MSAVARARRRRVQVVGYLPLTDNMLGAGRHPARRRAHDPQRHDRRGAQHRRRGPADPGRRARRWPREDGARRHRRPGHPHRRLHGGARRPRSPGSWATTTAWLDQVAAAADAAGEAVWPLPLPAEYRKQLDTEVADLKNIGDDPLRRRAHRRRCSSQRVRGRRHPVGPPRHRRPGLVTDDDDGELPKGGTGFGVRLLLELLADWSKPRN